jgi:tRNA 2-selenouridine synthase
VKASGRKEEIIMVKKVKAGEFIKLADRHPVIDVRSSIEFLSGHVSGALSIPLFTDEERSLVGTLYHKQGRDAAVLKGLDIALPKVHHYVMALNSLGGTGPVCLHCWRGGMRSEVMAEVFSRAGFQVFVLTGGYKSYRAFIREAFSKQAAIVVLGGMTGSGKTDIIRCLAGMGEQVIDLEDLASHKGSAFGALGQGIQPTNEQFENDLFRIWNGMDFRKRMWMEDESRRIGRIDLPPAFFGQVSNGILLKAVVDKNTRIERLVREYSGFPKTQLADALAKIRDGIGGTRYKESLKALDQDDFAKVVEMVLEYYDKAYTHAIEKRLNKNILPVSLEGTDPAIHARALLQVIKKTP